MKTLLIESGVAETRGALIDCGDVQQFFFEPAFGDHKNETDAGTGDIFLGRVKTISPAISGAFVDIGTARQGFLPIKNQKKKLTEGAAIIVRVLRPALAEKGAVLSVDWQTGLSTPVQKTIEALAEKAMPALRLNTPLNPVERMMRAINVKVDRIVVDDVRVANTVKSLMPHMHIENNETAFETHEIEAMIEEALSPQVVLPGGARIHFAETEGGCIIDVDAGSAVGFSDTLINDKINRAVTSVIAREINRRAIGGRIIIDFLPPVSAKSKSALLEKLKEVTRILSGARCGKLQSDGLFDLTVARRRVSLLEWASETSGDKWLRTGRKLTIDWQTKEAVSKLEATLRRMPRARPKLRLGAELFAWHRAHSQWQTRLSDRYGARFLIELSDHLEPREYDLAE